MIFEDQEAFKKTFNVRRVPKCCGTCRHFDRDYEESGCGHPRQAEFDSFAKAMKAEDPDYPETYGAYGGIYIDEGFVCELWEQGQDQAP